jgi:hypothetical protein
MKTRSAVGKSRTKKGSPCAKIGSIPSAEVLVAAHQASTMPIQGCFSLFNVPHQQGVDDWDSGTRGRWRGTVCSAPPAIASACRSAPRENARPPCKRPVPPTLTAQSITRHLDGDAPRDPARRQTRPYLTQPASACCRSTAAAYADCRPSTSSRASQRG